MAAIVQGQNPVDMEVLLGGKSKAQTSVLFFESCWIVTNRAGLVPALFLFLAT